MSLCNAVIKHLTKYSVDAERWTYEDHKAHLISRCEAPVLSQTSTINSELPTANRCRQVSDQCSLWYATAFLPHVYLAGSDTVITSSHHTQQLTEIWYTSRCYGYFNLIKPLSMSIHPSIHKKFLQFHQTSDFSENFKLLCLQQLLTCCIPESHQAGIYDNMPQYAVWPDPRSRRSDSCKHGRFQSICSTSMHVVLKKTNCESWYLKTISKC